MIYDVIILSIYGYIEQWRRLGLENQIHRWDAEKYPSNTSLNA